MKKAESHDAYRGMLMERRGQILASLGAKFDAVSGIGRVADDDRAPISHEEFISARRNRLEYAELRMVDEALDRMESNEFGRCMGCDEPIASKRLRALPWARYCVVCQESVGTAEPPDHEKVDGLNLRENKKRLAPTGDEALFGIR